LKDPKKIQFLEDREITIDNLDVLKQSLEMCINAGMHDIDEYFHNELLDLIDETVLAKNYPELEEVITKAKTIETDLEAWLASRGSSTLGLSWPIIK
jgi:hypothetical protein